MALATQPRVFGVETEFGCLVADESLGSADAVVDAVKDTIFHELRLGAIDLHARDDVFEPARNGGFLLNGGRLYVDAVGSHLEYATAECRSLRDLVANDRAGQRLIVRAVREMGLEGSVEFFNNSVDHFGGHTFGCHENYLVRADDDFLSAAASLLVPFLVTRQIYAGVGRVGGHLLTSGGSGPSYSEMMEHPVDYIWVSHVYNVESDATVAFQLSQRADHIVKTIASRVRFNRALINPKWEHFYSHDGLTRLHLLFGESNQHEFAYALKVGATALVIRLLEVNAVTEEVLLANPLSALREISRDPSFTWNAVMADGSTERATQIQRRYLDLAERFRGEDSQTDWTLDAWRSTLDALELNPLGLADKLDWVAKRQMVEQYRQEYDLEPGDDALHSIDLEYHNIDPDRSLFHAVQQMGQTERILSEADVLVAMTEPPQDTRAKGRSKRVREVLDRTGPNFYMFDWNGVALSRDEYIEMTDPLKTYAGGG